MGLKYYKGSADDNGNTETCQMGEKTSSIVYCLCFVFIPLLVSTILTISATKKFNEISNGYHSILDNWKKDMIFEAHLAKNEDPCLFGFEEEFKGLWSGTKPGCDCFNASDCEEDDEGQIHDSVCSSDQRFCGCVDVPATPSKELVRVEGVEKVCLMRKAGYNFYNMYKNMNIDGACKEGMKVCGAESGISNGVCFPQGEDCPIIEMRFGKTNPDESVFDYEVQGEENNLYYFRKNLGSPVVDTSLKHVKACLDGTKRYKGSRSNYKLEKIQPEDCIVDERYKAHRISIGEKSLFLQNSVQFEDLPRFNVRDVDLYHRMSRSLIEWSPKCHDLIEYMVDLQAEVKSFQKQLDTLGTVILIFLIVNAIIGLIGFRWDKEKDSEEAARLRKKIGCPIRNILVVVLVVMLVRTIIHSYKTKGIFLRISNEECSDSFTNNFFLVMEKGVIYYVFRNQLISLIMCSVMLLGDCWASGLMDIFCSCMKAVCGPIGKLCKEAFEGDRDERETRMRERRRAEELKRRRDRREKMESKAIGKSPDGMDYPDEEKQKGKTGGMNYPSEIPDLQVGMPVENYGDDVGEAQIVGRPKIHIDGLELREINVKGGKDRDYGFLPPIN